MGETGGPVLVGDHYVLILVEEVRPPRPGSWGEVGAAVEISLSEHALSDAEYVTWKVAMDRLHPADLSALDDLLR